MCHSDDYTTHSFQVHQKTTKTHIVFLQNLCFFSKKILYTCFRKPTEVLQRKKIHPPFFSTNLCIRTREDAQELERYRQLCGPVEVWSVGGKLRWLWDLSNKPRWIHGGQGCPHAQDAIVNHQDYYTYM